MFYVCCQVAYRSFGVWSEYSDSVSVTTADDPRNNGLVLSYRFCCDNSNFGVIPPSLRILQAIEIIKSAIGLVHVTKYAPFIAANDISDCCPVSMALNGLFCADVPLRNYSLTHSIVL